MDKHVYKRSLLLLATLLGWLIFTMPALAYYPGPVQQNPNLQPVLPLLVAPELAVVTPVPSVTYDKTPNLTFSSTEAGKITYSGDCTSTTVDAAKGNNTITFNSLDYGLHNNCKLTVKGNGSGLTSNPLNVAAFTVEVSIIIDITPPSLTLINGVSSPTDDNTPSIVFNTNEDGTISYEGACFSTTNIASSGDNSITFNTLDPGTYSNCKIRVTDLSGNISDPLSIPSFKINTPAMATCAGFSDISSVDSDCNAVAYVKGLGAMTGLPDGTFNPGGLLQRDQISKIVLETFGNFNKVSDYCAGQNPFPDVAESSWAYQYVCRAKALSVVTGYLSGPDAGFFRPARSVNRAEFLAILLRNLGTTMPTGYSYSDVPTDSWYANFAKYSMDNSLFSGSKLYPTNFTTRREVAEVIYRLHVLGKV